jgi:hypothetical protein
MFSSLGGGRGSTHTSMSSALPMIFIFVLLAGLPLSASSSTRSSRSCHLAVAEDRLALPAQSSSLPVIRWAGSVDRVVRPLAVYPVQTKIPGAARTRRSGTGVVPCSGSGWLGSVAEKAPTTSLAPPRQKEACATTGHEGGAGRGVRSLEAVRDARANSDRRGPGQLLPNQVAPARTPPLRSSYHTPRGVRSPLGFERCLALNSSDSRQVCPQGTWSRLHRTRPRTLPGLLCGCRYQPVAKSLLRHNGACSGC